MAQNNTPNYSLHSRLSHGGLASAETHYEWSVAENESFEMALALNDMHMTPLNWTCTKAMTPTNTDSEFMKHYIDQIEAGVYDAEMTNKFCAHQKVNGNTIGDDDGIRKKKQPFAHWTQVEHMNFLKGLREHGRKWKTIAKDYVRTRDNMQVASHAQKYFKKQEQNNNASSSGEGSKNSRRKKRTSIHDITVESLTSGNVVMMNQPPHHHHHGITITSDDAITMPQHVSANNGFQLII